MKYIQLFKYYILYVLGGEIYSGIFEPVKNIKNGLIFIDALAVGEIEAYYKKGWNCNSNDDRILEKRCYFLFKAMSLINETVDQNEYAFINFIIGIIFIISMGYQLPSKQHLCTDGGYRYELSFWYFTCCLVGMIFVVLFFFLY